MGKKWASLEVPSDPATYVGERCPRHGSDVRYKRSGHCCECVAEFARNISVRNLLIRVAPDGVTPRAHAQVILAAQGGRCADCGSTKGLVLDHKKALAFGGDHWPANRQWLCSSCNTKKWCYEQDDWRRRQGLPAVTPWDAPTDLLRALDDNARDTAARIRFGKRARRVGPDPLSVHDLFKSHYMPVVRRKRSPRRRVLSACDIWMTAP